MSEKVVCSRCSREQSISRNQDERGVSLSMIKRIGWRTVNGQQLCPFCSGNTSNLERIFKRRENQE